MYEPATRASSFDVLIDKVKMKFTEDGNHK